MEDLNTIKEVLHFYVEDMGWEVFPIKPREKSPPLVRWQDEASKDFEKALSWWEENPYANLGLRCGSDSGVVVIDIDPNHSGDESLLGLFSKYGEFPHTVVCMSGGGGAHYYFRHPNIKIPSRNGWLAKGIDIKADGGYVLLPPSIHPSGKPYLWKPDHLPSKTPLAELPEWLLDLIKEDTTEEFERNVTRKSRPLPIDENEPFVSGMRNERLTSLAGSMRRRGMSREAIFDALATENTKKCVPPLSDFEVSQIADSVSRYTPAEVPKASAMVVSGRRAQLEWLFAAAVFADPVLAVKTTGWLDERAIGSEKLRKFWRRIKNGDDKTEVANDLAILPDLMEWTSKLSSASEVDSLAMQVSRNSYVDNIADNLPMLGQAVAAADVEKIRQIVEGMGKENLSSGHHIKSCDESLDEFEKMLDNIRERSIPSHLKPLDDILGGFEKQTLTIIGARPGVGKTTLAWQIARCVAGGDKKVLFFSLEMSAAALWAKAASGVAKVRLSKLRSDQCTDEEKSELKRISNSFRQKYASNLLISDIPMTTDMIWGIVANHAPDFVVIDHLRLLKDLQGEINEDKRLGFVSQRLKEMAKIFNVPVLCLAQLNRSVEGRENKKPHLSDLRDSGQIEENADNVLMLYREDYYDDKRTDLPYPDTKPTEIILRKMRDGGSGEKCVVNFNVSEQWFYDPIVFENQEIVEVI